MITGAETAHLVARPTVIMLEGRLPVLETRAVQSLGLHDGQVIRPTVEVRDGRMQLMIQGLSIEVPPGLRLAAGERPWWRVQVDARGHWSLQPLAAGLTADTAALEPASQNAGRISQLALRPPGMEGLATLMQPGALQALMTQAQQPEVRSLLSQLMGFWSPVARLSPETLRRLVRQGGWAQESALARGEGAPDAKSLLRLLVQQWTEAPASTQAMLREALNDIEGRQLQAAADHQAGRDLSFGMMLPFSQSSPVSVRWKRPPRSPGQEKAPWVIDLHTRSSEFGEVWMRTRVDGSLVDLTLWAERPELARWARASTTALALWLEEAGLRMGGLQVIDGPRPSSELVQAPAAAGSLVDLKV